MGVCRSAILLLVAGCSAVDTVDQESQAERVYRRIRDVFHETPMVTMTFRTSSVWPESEWLSRGQPGTVFLKGDLIRIATGVNGGMADFIFTSNGRQARLALKLADEPTLLDPPHDLSRTVRDDLLLGRVCDFGRLAELPRRNLRTSGFVLGRDLCDRPTLTYTVTRAIEWGVVETRVQLTYAPRTFALAQIDAAQCMGSSWFRTLFVTQTPTAMPADAFEVEDGLK